MVSILFITCYLRAILLNRPALPPVAARFSRPTLPPRTRTRTKRAGPHRAPVPSFPVDRASLEINSDGSDGSWVSRRLRSTLSSQVLVRMHKDSSRQDNSLKGVHSLKEARSPREVLRPRSHRRPLTSGGARRFLGKSHRRLRLLSTTSRDQWVDGNLRTRNMCSLRPCLGASTALGRHGSRGGSLISTGSPRNHNRNRTVPFLSLPAPLKHNQDRRDLSWSSTSEDMMSLPNRQRRLRLLRRHQQRSLRLNRVKANVYQRIRVLLLFWRRSVGAKLAKYPQQVHQQERR